MFWSSSILHEQRRQIVHALGSPSAAPSPRPVLPAALLVPAQGGKWSPARRAASTFIPVPPACSGHASFPSGTPGKRDAAGARGETREGGQSAANAPEVERIRPNASSRLAAAGAHHREATRAPRVKLNLQPQLAPRAGSCQSRLGLPAPPGFTWHRPGTDARWGELGAPPFYTETVRERSLLGA